MIPNSEISSEIPQETANAADRRTSGWDISNAPRNYVSLVVYQAGSAFLSFGAVWVITQYLGSEGYGGIIAITAASQVAQILVNWTSSAVVRFGIDEFIDSEKISRIFWLRFFVLAANISIVAGLSPLWFGPLANWLKLGPNTFWLVLSHFAVTALLIHVQMSLQGIKLLRTQGLLQMVERFLIFSGLLVLSLSAWMTPERTMICYIAAPLLAALAGLFLLRKYIFSRFSLDWAFLLKFISYSAPLLPFSLIGYFSGGYLDAVFLSQYLSTKDLGIYSVATQISGIAMQLPTLANTLLTPMVVTLEKEERSDKITRFVKDVLPTLVLAWGVVCTGIAFVASFAVPLIFGSEFSGSVAPLWILLASSCIAIPVLIGYAAISHAISATYIFMWAAIFAAVMNVCFNFLLIPRFGLIGCAWATALSYLSVFVTQAILLSAKKRIQISWTFAAMLPSTVGAALISAGVEAYVAIAASLAFALFTVFLKSGSIRVTLAFAGDIGKRSASTNGIRTNRSESDQ